MTNLIQLYLDDKYNLVFFLNKCLTIALIVGIAVFLLVLFIKRKFLFPKLESLEIDCAEIGIGKSKVKLVPNYNVAQTAYRLWVELSTRKIGIPIDFDHDVIYEIYNSWYEFFRVTRELTKSIPAEKVRHNKDTLCLVKISIEVLNIGLRPHLTQWQARFRNWYDNEIKKSENLGKEPQIIQKEFPQYAMLVEDMRAVNVKMMSYRRILENLSFGKVAPLL